MRPSLHRIGKKPVARNHTCDGLAEMEGFEPSRGVTRLPHFECGPFNRLGTSP